MSSMEIRNIPIDKMDGTKTSLNEYAGDVVLVVNVASRCGLAPQYAKLEELQREYGNRGFSVLGFPSNQFLQELSSKEAIQEFCSTTYGVTFPVFDKIRVNGRHTHPLYSELKKTKDDGGKAGRIRWNFEKFLILPNGQTRCFSPRTEPDDPAIVGLIEANLPR
ncbi:glutathione peroxidase [Paeniglutamicibacter cryotolerans]|uniref:Glutathione peroxidase n=2 Tax=Paeniglutamicibacter cryotolerans TaxID=670079 RepID=A0A839QDA8_9MICC|nr:glutathione peroxidase [Paeniglutamicibacter cryotolerans]